MTRKVVQPVRAWLVGDRCTMGCAGSRFEHRPGGGYGVCGFSRSGRWGVSRLTTMSAKAAMHRVVCC